MEKIRYLVSGHLGSNSASSQKSPFDGADEGYVEDVIEP